MKSAVGNKEKPASLLQAGFLVASHLGKVLWQKFPFRQEMCQFGLECATLSFQKPFSVSA